MVVPLRDIFGAKAPVLSEVEVAKQVVDVAALGIDYHIQLVRVGYNEAQSGNHG
ncbi:hypothetical protein [Puniceicoccus vermicola]|uniref:Uncharacterized protein n=1 Tax=Puniceicoccus vermicola TaxID=388746 RepID=A0A7X1B4A0_9BACT|nr:hypothetical protein [Puniceicoccus vermicola]MBC2604243.1 hypothetical protein [Puniceicoccus vermicola]